jgi:uncharacterized MAPEG superfamily protein
MTTDLWMLVWSSFLCVMVPFVYVGGLGQVPGGFAWGFGNREKPMELPPWAARAKRGHANLVENLAPFAALVLVAHVAGKANATTALGATLFFWGRVAHFVVYTLGIPYLRTAVFAVASVGELLILLQLFA